MISKILRVVALGLAPLALGCAVVGADSASTDSALDENPDDAFRPVVGCEIDGYVGEVDFTDRKHPRYRIRHSDGSMGQEVGKQNIALQFDRAYAWGTDDSLVSVYSDIRTPALREGSDRSVPWREFPVPTEVLNQAFDRTGIHLFGAAFTFNKTLRLDPVCGAEFFEEK